MSPGSKQYFPKFVGKLGKVFAAGPSLVGVALLAGCGARSTLDSAPACEEDACDPPRVEECVRLAKEATPLAVIHDNFGRFVLNDDAIYFVSDRRFYRLRLDAGPAEAITPPPADGSEPGSFDVGFGTIVWFEGSVLRAASTAGGAVRTVATMPEEGLVVVTKDRVLTTAGAGDPFNPKPTYVVPLAGGAPEKLVDAWSIYGAKRDDATDQVFFATLHGLVAVDPVTGKKTTWTTDSSDFRPAITNGKIFAAGFPDDLPLGTHSGIQAILEVTSPRHAEQVARGIFISMGSDAEGVAFDGALDDPKPSHASIGYLAAGEAPTLLAESDSTVLEIGEDSFYSTSLASDGAFVYWPSVCLHSNPREFRLVRMAKP